MAIIKLQSPSELLNLLRKYQIYIDGINIGTISNGETKEFSISEGQHIMIAKLDWCSSQEINFYIEENQSKVFNIEGFKNRKWIIPMGIGIVTLGVFLNSFYNIELNKFIAPIIGCLFIYYFIVERKKYLTLSENIEQ